MNTEQAKQELGTDTVTFTLMYEDSESASNMAAFVQSEIGDDAARRDGGDAGVPKKVRHRKTCSLISTFVAPLGARTMTTNALLSLYTSDRFANSITANG